MDLESLSRMTREELIQQARRIGIARSDHLTRAELRDEIVRRTERDVQLQRAARGWFGVARDLVASVVEAGLHLPDAARLIRGDLVVDPRYQPPVATVTLADIYAAQGHLARALKMLEEVLAKEPDHEAARALHDKLAARAAPPVAAAAGESASERAAVTDAEPATPDAVSETSPEPVPAAASTDGTPKFEVRGAERAASPANVAALGSDPATGGSHAEAEICAARDTGAAAAGSDAGGPPLSTPRNDDTTLASAVLLPSDESEREGAEAPSDPVTPLAEKAGAWQEPVSVTEDALFLRRRGGAIELYWELAISTEQRLRDIQPEATPVILLVSFTPMNMSAERQQHERMIQASRGRVAIDCAPESAVRAAIGWRTEHGFRPLAVATHLTEGRPAPTYVPYAARSARNAGAHTRALEQFGMS